MGSFAAIGDSLTAGYNAQYNDDDACRFTDTKDYSYASNTAASNGTYSIAERAIAANATSIPIWNVGEDGAKMKDGDTQAAKIKTASTAADDPKQQIHNARRDLSVTTIHIIDANGNPPNIPRTKLNYSPISQDLLRYTNYHTHSLKQI